VSDSGLDMSITLLDTPAYFSRCGAVCGRDGLIVGFAVRTEPPADGVIAEFASAASRTARCTEVGVQDVGLTSKAVGCLVLAHRAVVLFLRLMLVQEVSKDRVDV
jgi:hypothetical protein